MAAKADLINRRTAKTIMQYEEFAKVYDRLMRDVDYDAWADYVCGFMPAGCSVLECACGTGELTKRIAQRGNDVIATDISQEMLRVASEKLRLLGAVSRRVHFACMDMREAAVHKPVDCVAACCDGVNYLLSREDVKRFFRSAYAALKPSGLLLFDVSSRYKLENVLGGNCFADNDEEAPYMWRNAYDPESKLIEMELTFFVKRGGSYERFDERHVQRGHSVNELVSWLLQCGFEPTAYDFLSLDGPKPDSERIQFAARKI